MSVGQKTVKTEGLDQADLTWGAPRRRGERRPHGPYPIPLSSHSQLPASCTCMGGDELWGDTSPWSPALPFPRRETQSEQDWSGALEAWAQSELPDSEHSEAVLAQTMTTGNWKHQDLVSS